jgi:hypothetical protein
MQDVADGMTCHVLICKQTNERNVEIGNESIR